MVILEWKWERIAMDFIVGLFNNLGQHDSIWLIVDKLSHLSHYIPVKGDYSIKQIAKMCIMEILRLMMCQFPSISIEVHNLPLSFGIGYLKS